jgi:DHA3 family multidrug efflux protein-like MFS transporter
MSFVSRVSGAPGTAEPEEALVGRTMASTFPRLLANTLVTGVSSTFLWFSLTFWVFLETDSVVASGVIAGGFSISSALLAPVFGTFVDRHRKRTAMLVATTVATAAFAVAAAVFFTVDDERLLRLTGPWFWVLIASTLVGSVAGQLRGIALSTSVTLLVPESDRDRANGMVGTVTGLSFALTSVFSGLAVGGLGMGWAYAAALALTVVALLHLATVRFDEPTPERADGEHVPVVDLRSAITAVRAAPGLPLLIGLAAFNNLLAGVFMALMDPYGLSLVSVETWGVLWAVLSLAMIGGGVIVSRRGLGRSPVRLIVGANLAIWTACSLFALRSSIVLVALGMVVWLALIPAIEAAEQTVLQASVPFEQQGRVFGFAQLIENAASPVTAFLMAPLAESVFMPLMTDGAGADLIGGWFGTGPDRGLALMFTIAGLAGVAVTALARRSRAFCHLEARTAKAPAMAPDATPECPVAGALLPAA